MTLGKVKQILEEIWHAVAIENISCIANHSLEKVRILARCLTQYRSVLLISFLELVTSLPTAHFVSDIA
jgi:hypothetical protein